MKRLVLALLLMTSVLGFHCPLEAQESIISRKDADYVFSLTRPRWEADSKKFFAPGWISRVSKFESGSAVFGFDPATGVGLSIKPFYNNDRDPPDSVIVGNYFPLGALPPMTADLKKDMEAAAQADLGVSYSVRLIYTKLEKNEIIELLLTKK